MGVFGFPRENEFDGLVWQYAGAEGIDPLLVKAEMAQESGFDPGRMLPEPALADASRGLMQVLYKTAVWLGYRGDPGDDASRTGGLYDPETSVKYGAAYLGYQWRRYSGSPTQETDAIAAYNAGTARRDAEGYYVNTKGERTVQLHVDRVARYLEGYRAAYAAGPTGPVLPELAPIEPEPGAELPPAEGFPPEIEPGPEGAGVAALLAIAGLLVAGILVTARRR